VISLEEFRNPSKKYRGIPFFSVNDELDPDKVREKVAELDAAGFGGAFFHAREGLLTPFLSERWFQAFGAALEEAEKRGMTMWAYDEDRWPSGFGGGTVAAMGPDYRAKAILMIPSTAPIEVPPEAGEAVAAFECDVGDDLLPTSYRRLPVNGEGDSAEGPGTTGAVNAASQGAAGGARARLYLNFLKYTASVGDPWHGGLSYVDLLNPSVTDAFINFCYAPYAQRFKGKLGSALPGIFTDEPNLSASRPPRSSIPGNGLLRGAPFPIFSLPWTDPFPAIFEKSNGYDLTDKLPELFFDVGSYSKTRYDYWRTLTSTFVENFSKRIYDWCQRNGLKFTGHYLAEDDLISQLVVGATMPHYEFEHIPGIDHLCNQVWNGLLTVKQVASVANQLGKERVLCETYGATGNHPSFEDRKWIADFLLAGGVNMINHHLFPYSLRGRRKDDYGLTFHKGQPWWKYNYIMEDYVARLSYALSQGTRIADVLVIHPMGSVWSSYSPADEGKAKFINDRFFELLRELLKAHRDFELGDEILLAKYGEVKDGRLWVGRASYETVVIPPSYTISRKTLELLKSFAQSGGSVIAVQPLPTAVDASEAVGDELKRFRAVGSPAEAALTLRANGGEISVECDDDENGEVLVHARKVDNEVLVFVANLDREGAHSVNLSLKGRWTLQRLDPLTGKAEKEGTSYSDGRTTLSGRAELGPAGSALWLASPQAGEGNAEARSAGEPAEEGKTRLEIPVQDWSFEPVEKNALLLDYATMPSPSPRSLLASSSASPSSENPPPLHVSAVKRRLMAMGPGKEAKVIFTAEVEELPPGKVYLVVERNPNVTSVSFNGVPVSAAPSFNWLDEDFPAYDISSLLKVGPNEVEVGIRVGLDFDLEPLYLLGDFEVEAMPAGRSRIRRKRGGTPSSFADLAKEGYPFYCGEVTLSGRFSLQGFPPGPKRVYLELRYSAALAVVRINGSSPIYAINKRERLDVTELVKDGNNGLKITLVGTLANALGPLHRKAAKTCVGPESFYASGGDWTDDYVTYPLGLDECTVVAII